MYEVKGCQSSEVIQQNSPYVSHLIVAPQIHLRVTNRWVAVSGGPQDVERERERARVEVVGVEVMLHRRLQECLKCRDVSCGEHTRRETLEVFQFLARILI